MESILISGLYEFRNIHLGRKHASSKEFHIASAGNILRTVKKLLPDDNKLPQDAIRII